MLRKRLLLIVFLGIVGTSCAQDQIHNTFAADSMAFVQAHWQIDTLDGILFRRHHFMHRQVFNSNQYFSIIEMPRGTDSRLAFVADTHLTAVSEFARRYQAQAAINGSYFDMRYGNPVCYLRIGGQEIGENTPAADDPVHRKYYQYATIRLLNNGKPRFVVPDSNRLFEVRMPDSNIMTAGPMLLLKGRRVHQRDDRSFVTQRHNRTAIGLKADGTVVLLVADGRFRRESEGLSLRELAMVMRWLGCVDAVNLDGGGSSTMYVADRGREGVVNHPSDNGHFDPYGERSVSNAILVLKPGVARLQPIVPKDKVEPQPTISDTLTAPQPIPGSSQAQQALPKY